MATRFLLRSFLFSGANQTLASTVSRSYATLPLSTSSLLMLRPLLVVAANILRPSSPVAASVREFSTRQTTSSLNDSSPNWSNRPPKETILLDGCDFNHWLVVVEKPEGEPTRDEIIDSYINTLAKVVGSYDEARMKIYSVSTRCYYAFGALVSEEDSYKLKELPGVRWVLPDSYLDVKNKDYGGEPFIDGKAVPYDPKYHEEWIRNNARANERNRRNDRPRNFDRSRNFERRREHMQNSGPPLGGGAMGGPPNNMGGPPRNTGGPPAPNMGGMQQGGGMGGVQQGGGMGGVQQGGGMGGVQQGGGMGGVQQGGGMGGVQQGGGMGGVQQGGGMGGMQQGGGRGGPPNVGGQPNNWHGPPPNNMGGMPNYAPSYQQQQQRYGPNSGGMPYQSGPGPNSGGTPYQSGPGPNNYAANIGGGGSQDMPGRDMDMPPSPNYQ